MDYWHVDSCCIYADRHNTTINITVVHGSFPKILVDNLVYTLVVPALVTAGHQHMFSSCYANELCPVSL